MKEATGELNMAVIVAISVGILSAFFFGFLWPLINSNFHSTSQCNKAYCDCSLSTRESVENETGKRGYCKCAENAEEFGKGNIYYCPYKG